MSSDLPQRVLVLGLGRFGGNREAVRWLVRRGCTVRVADKLSAGDLEATVTDLREDPALPADRIEWRLGEEQESLLDGIELVVVNPAIPPSHPLLGEAEQRGIPLDQEVGLFLAHYPGRVVLVTGTNGKSTTATMLHAALQRGGIDALLGGNVGHSLLADHERWREAPQVAVVEASSFQLERLDPARHRVAGAVFTPVTRDHIDRHGTLEAYHAAKARAAELATEFVIHDQDNAVCAGFATSAMRLTHRAGPGSGPAPDEARLGAWRGDDGYLVVRDQNDARCTRPLVHASALELPGDFHIGNALGALLAATRLGADAGGAALAVALQRPLPYRLQRFTRLGSVQVYDNGVSTAVESTVSALDAIRPAHSAVHWVGGGKSKEGPEALPGAARELASRLAGAHLFGAVASDLASALREAGVRDITEHERLEQALDAAHRSAREAAAAPALLFSPAFASFDQYENFKARAEAFRSWCSETR